MDLLEELTGKKVTFADLLWLPEDQKLAKIRARYSPSLATLLHGNGTIKDKEIRRQDEALERAAITLTEGGGGALYLVCSRLKKNGFEGKIARCVQRNPVGRNGPQGGRGFALWTRCQNRYRVYARRADYLPRSPASVCACAMSNSIFR